MTSFLLHHIFYYYALHYVWIRVREKTAGGCKRRHFLLDDDVSCEQAHVSAGRGLCTCATALTLDLHCWRRIVQTTIDLCDCWTEPVTHEKDRTLPNNRDTPSRSLMISNLLLFLYYVLPVLGFISAAVCLTEIKSYNNVSTFFKEWRFPAAVLSPAYYRYLSRVCCCTSHPC